MKTLAASVLSLICLQLYACAKNKEMQTKNNFNKITSIDTMNLKITIGDKTFTATLFDNATAAAFMANLPMSINMKELNGNEKYYDLSKSLPTNSSNPGTIQTGDLMIYGANTLVLFY